MIDPNTIPEHPRRATTYDYFRILCDRRIRYYGHYKAAKILGKTAGARLVVEVDFTGTVGRTWYESYDSQNRVIRIHPKTPKDLGHIELNPLTGKETARW
ncbi:hypothetical protein [Phormidesmis priestleyi]